MKDDICQFCLHRRDHHHKGCDICQAIPSRHGLYCDEPLCCCLAFVEEGEFLTDEDIAALIGESL